MWSGNDPRDPRAASNSTASSRAAAERGSSNRRYDARPARSDGAADRRPDRTSARSKPAPAAPRTARSPRAPRPAAPAGNQRPPVRTPAPRQQASVRGRRVRRSRTAVGNPRMRSRLALIVLLSMLMLAGGKLVMIQAIDTSDYAAKSEAQRTRTISLLAQRGSISDRNGTALAFTVEGRAIAARPALFTDDAQRQAVAAILVSDVGNGLTSAGQAGPALSSPHLLWSARFQRPTTFEPSSCMWR